MWKRLQAHLEPLIGLSAAQRETALEVLRRQGVAAEILDGLRACFDEDFLEGSAWTAAPGLMREIAGDTVSEDWIGRRFGAWKVVEHLGRGGMGSVFAVERADGEYELTAALKLLTAHWGAEAVERFRAERQILARLDHPHIARLLDAGATETGTPWFVMEYVDGMPITSFCEHHGLALAARLRLFEKVCRAVDSAHNQLIVHRDLKPSNILVSDDGEPHLLDFGVAKALAGSGDTTRFPTQRWLTLAYASPEQIRGVATSTRSDTYQLGLILYELLTGELPYSVEGLSPLRAEEVIIRGEIRRPSAVVEGAAEAAPGHPAGARRERLSRRLRGDLDTIALQALSRQPERGYVSAASLADDIDFHLRGLPIHARRDSLSYRTMKFVQRHRVGVAASVLAALALAGFLAYHTVSLTAERDQAQIERDRATQATEFMVQLFEALEPSTTAADAATAQRLVATGMARVDALVDQPLLQAKALTALGQVSYGLGMMDEAEEQLRAAIALHDRELGSGSPDAAASRQVLAFILWTRGQVLEAEAHVRQAIGPRRLLFGDDAAAVGDSVNLLALILRDQGRYEESAAAHREALALRFRLHGPSSASIAVSLDNLATTIAAQGNLDAAETLHRQALAMNHEVWGPRHVLVATNMSNLGRLLTLQGQFDEAGALLTDALAMKRELWGPHHYSVASTLCHLGDLRRRSGHLIEAATLLDECLAIFERAGNPLRIAMAHTYRGDLRRELADRDGADVEYPKARTADARPFPGDHPLLADSDERLGRLEQE